MVYDKHKFKISSPNINQKFIKCLRDNDIKIVDNYTVEKDNGANNNELILYVTDKMASNISSILFIMAIFIINSIGKYNADYIRYWISKTFFKMGWR